MKSKTFLTFVFIQIFVITGLLLLIRQKTRKTSSLSINPIYSKTIQKIQDGELKYFYEPQANTIETVHKSWLSYVPEYTINNDSLNERFNYDVKKTKETFRIITIGDSFTFGENVSTQNNWTELLEDELNRAHRCNEVRKYEVINLGVPGYDTTYEVERYKIRGQKYTPDLVIWFVTDLDRVTEKIQPLIKKMNIDEKNNEKNGVFYEDWKKAMSEIVNMYGESELINYQVSKFKEFRDKYYFNKPLLFISDREEIKKNLGSKNIYYDDIEIGNDRKNILPDYHFSSSGHIKFANEIVKTLHINKLLPCN